MRDIVSFFEGDWLDGGIHGSGYYQAYTQDDALLLVGMNLETDLL